MKKEEILLEWHTEDEITFLEDLRIRQETIKLNNYSRSIEQRVNWGDINKDEVVVWLRENGF